MQISTLQDRLYITVIFTFALLCKYLHNKALVENQVKLVYQRVYARLRNHVFFSVAELNRAIGEKILQHNQTRMQQRDYSREEHFLADEKGLLKTLPLTGFEIRYYASLRVQQNSCIYLARDKHYYSVPYACTGEKASVVYTRTLVRIYCKSELVATHQRNIGFGYTVVREHMPSAHQHYMDRSPEYYMDLARKRSDGLLHLMEMMFAKEETPEVLYKRCDGLLSLQRKTDPSRFEEACQVAVANGIPSYQFVRRRIENRMTSDKPSTIKKLPEHENIRGDFQ